MLNRTVCNSAAVLALFVLNGQNVAQAGSITVTGGTDYVANSGTWSETHSKVATANSITLKVDAIASSPNGGGSAADYNNKITFTVDKDTAYSLALSGTTTNIPNEGTGAFDARLYVHLVGNGATIIPDASFGGGPVNVSNSGFTNYSAIQAPGTGELLAGHS